MSDDPVATCVDCAYGEYHPARAGDFDSPPEEAYCVCRHPRVACNEVYDPAVPAEQFRCRYWLFRSDDAGVDATFMPFEVWRRHWSCDPASGELITI